MRQILTQHGKVLVENVPSPTANDDTLLVRTHYALISTGTELSSVASSAESLVKKALAQPEQIKKVLGRLRRVGIVNTYRSVKDQLESTKGLGYSCSGEIITVGKNIKDFSKGGRVACAGQNHAEIIRSTKNLTIKVPPSVDLKDASFVALGSVALHAVRRSGASIGENIVVLGLGLVGQLAVQILKAAGCHVIGVDVERNRIQRALKSGCEHGFVANSKVVQNVLQVTDGNGADAVLICAATPTNTPVEQALAMARKKGRVVVVGTVGMNVPRPEFYNKELDFLIATSYGPGRYDESYEKQGIDYPIGYVRWTERRNMEEFIRMIAEKKVAPSSLVDDILPIEQAPKAYSSLHNAPSEPIAVLIEFERQGAQPPETKVVLNPKPLSTRKIKVAVIGCGDFARAIHLPNLSRSREYEIMVVVSRTGRVANDVAKHYKAQYATTSYDDVVNDPNVDMVLISTRHNTHAEIATAAAKAGKAIFLEKPMALNRAELKKLTQALQESQVPFTVGFNRRFSPFSIKAKQAFSKRQNPLMMTYRVNAGYVPPDHWINGQEGGGRIIGECCHFFDFFTFFTESDVSDVDVQAITPQTSYYSKLDNFSALVRYADGSVGVLIYTALGSSLFPKERVEIFADRNVVVIDNFSALQITDSTRKRVTSHTEQKGFAEELQWFGNYIRGTTNLSIPLHQLVQTTELTFKVDELIRKA